MAKMYRVRVYRELEGWVYVPAKSKKEAISNAAKGIRGAPKEEREVSIRIGGEAEEVKE